MKPRALYTLLLLLAVGLLFGCNAPPAKPQQEQEREAVEVRLPSTASRPLASALPTQAPAPTPIDERISLTFSFAGDCTLGDPPTAGRSSFLNVVGEDYAYPFARVKSLFAADDCTIVNLEGPFTDHETKTQKEFNFKAPPRYAQILTEGSIEAVNLANNHTMDYGEQGLADTKQALDAQGVAYVGDREIAYLTIQEVKIALLGYYSGYRRDFASDIQTARAQGASVVIACVHGGEEGAYQPASRQVEMNRKLIDEGADIVFGTHSHVLQPIEVYKDKYILYSMGNFSFGGNKNPSDYRTAIARWEIVVQDGVLISQALTAIPAAISGDLNRNNYQPQLEYNAERIAQIHGLLKY